MSLLHWRKSLKETLGFIFLKTVKNWMHSRKCQAMKSQGLTKTQLAGQPCVRGYESYKGRI